MAVWCILYRCKTLAKEESCISQPFHLVWQCVVKCSPPYIEWMTSVADPGSVHGRGFTRKFNGDGPLTRTNLAAWTHQCTCVVHWNCINFLVVESHESFHCMWREKEGCCQEDTSRRERLHLSHFQYLQVVQIKNQWVSSITLSSGTFQAGLKWEGYLHIHGRLHQKKSLSSRKRIK